MSELNRYNATLYNGRYQVEFSCEAKTWTVAAHKAAEEFHDYCVSDFEWKELNGIYEGVIPIDKELWIKITLERTSYKETKIEIWET